MVPGISVSDVIGERLYLKYEIEKREGDLEWVKKLDVMIWAGRLI